MSTERTRIQPATGRMLPGRVRVIALSGMLSAILAAASLTSHGNENPADSATSPAGSFNSSRSFSEPTPKKTPRRYPRLRFGRIINPGQFAHPHWGRGRDMAFKLAAIPGLLDAASRRRTLPSERIAAVSVARKKQPGSHGADAADRIVIAIDPGHGGADPGSIAENGLIEKDLTLDIANRLRDMLAKDPTIEVILTREDDDGLSRRSRVEAIRDIQADLMVSVHFNSLPQKDVNLVETYYAAPANIAESLILLGAREENADQEYVKASGEDALEFAFTKGSARLARVLHEKVYKAVASANPAAVDAGLKNDTLYVLTRSFTPGILMEISCLSNSEEADRLLTNGYRDRIARALAEGLRSYRRLLVESPLSDIGV